MTRTYKLRGVHKDTIKRRKRNGEIYRFYIDFLFRKGVVPTEEEIGKKFGFTRQRAGAILKRLRKEGYVMKLDRCHKSYLPVDLLDITKKKKLQNYASTKKS